jgi:hypothetical protein
MAAEIVLIVTGTLISVVMQYVHSLAGFGHHLPGFLLTVTRVRVHADTKASYANNNGANSNGTNNNDANTDSKLQSSLTIKVGLAINVGLLGV